MSVFFDEGIHIASSFGVHRGDFWDMRGVLHLFAFCVVFLRLCGFLVCFK